MTDSPFAYAAATYLERGWSVFPLPPGKKSPPPKGVTGYGAQRLTQADLARARPDGNLGVWAAPGILGIDVDAYEKKGVTKTGDVTLAELEKLLGPLPDTWTSSARPAPSGIRWFRVPTHNDDGSERRWISKLPGIEFIQDSHRYGVVWPSTNPDADGAPYLWRKGGRSTTTPPWVKSLVALPVEWVGHLTKTGTSRTIGVRGDDLELSEAREWLTTVGSGVACRAIRGVLRTHKVKFEDGSSRYDNMVEGQMALLNLAVEGHPGVAWAMPQLKAAYLEAVAGEDRGIEAEWRRALVGGIAKQIEAGSPAPHHPDGKCPQMTSPTDADSSVWPAPTVPLDVADRYVREVYDLDGEPTLRFWRGDFYTWRGSHWREFDEITLTSKVADVLRHATYTGAAATPTELPWKPTPPKLKQVVDSMRYIIRCLRDKEADADDSSGRGVTFANGVLDLSTRELHKHSPAWFNLAALPYDYDPHAPEPIEWLKFLKSLWGDGDEIALLQEWIGYLVSGRTDLQKLIFLIGVPGAGKGVITKVCEDLVGKDNHAPLYPESLVGDFGLEKAVGKVLLTMGDARFSTKVARDALQKILTIVGGDSVPVTRKYKKPWEGVLGGRFMISTNEPPNIPDSANALSRRTLLLYFRESFVGREDRKLPLRLRAELPGILNWAMEGYDRLVSLGEDTDNWTRPASSVAILREIEEMGAPVRAFLRECCRRSEDGATAKSKLYAAWVSWCGEHGRHATSDAIFFRDLYMIESKLKRDLRLGSGRNGDPRYYAVGGLVLRDGVRGAGDLR
jgi:putative DNA primase/helicase